MKFTRWALCSFALFALLISHLPSIAAEVAEDSVSQFAEDAVGEDDPVVTELLKKAKEVLDSVSGVIDLADENRWGNQSSGVQKDVIVAQDRYKVGIHWIETFLDQLKLSRKKALKDSRLKELRSELESVAGYAYNSLGEIHLYMEDQTLWKQNFSSVIELFEKAESLGSPDAQHNLAVLYSLGIGVEQDTRKAVLYDYFASIGGSLRASLSLGYRHLKGLSVPKSCETAAKYYSLVAEHVVNQAYDSALPTIERASLLDESSRKKAVDEDENVVQYYHHTADAGDVNAQVAVGHMYYFGARGLQRNYNIARNYYMQAANQGNTVAMAQLGQMYVDGHGVDQSNETALEYFKKASKKGSAPATFGLGYMYFHGFGVKKDLELAFKYFKMAADAGYAEAQFSLGTMYFTGHGVDKSDAAALQYFTLAGHQSHPRALHNLAQMYMYGLGTRSSCSMGVELYKQVAERGDWGVDLKEALESYLEGDYERSVLLYSRLAEEGVKVAQINAAYMFSEGNGYYEENGEDISFRLWKNAADQGDASAYRKLGDYYYYGRVRDGVDYKKALDQYRQAAEKRNAHAMFNLGFMYQFGVGCEQDFHLAKRYYDLSIETEENAFYPSTFAIYGVYFHRWIIRNFGNWLGIDPSLGSEPLTVENHPSGSPSKSTKGMPRSHEPPSSWPAFHVPSWLKTYLNQLQDFVNLEDALVEDVLLVGLSIALAIVIFLRQHRREVPVQQQQPPQGQNHPQNQ
eukprot:TRINITY_DN8701_c0_g1_i1.p1 TRINITY_DN8701_c0_g1~~TRINITY_DN8701_c0_g1_i1.p1  ORF type:complete len:744 (-),score=149.93 TRINITY_DN8701_c0_g1_i1:1333-3564(-)